MEPVDQSPLPSHQEPAGRPSTGYLELGTRNCEALSTLRGGPAAARRYNGSVRYVRQAGTDPSFLVKALGEAAGELRRAVEDLRQPQLLAPGTGVDEDWTLLGVIVHVRDVERGIHDQLEPMVRWRRRSEPEIPHVDLDDIPLLEDYRGENATHALYGFCNLRQHTTYALWDIEESGWERAGIHPYRGRMTVTDLMRELYRHDLEHLWQVRRMLEAL